MVPKARERERDGERRSPTRRPASPRPCLRTTAAAAAARTQTDSPGGSTGPAAGGGRSLSPNHWRRQEGQRTVTTLTTKNGVQKSVNASRMMPSTFDAYPYHTHTHDELLVVHTYPARCCAALVKRFYRRSQQRFKHSILKVDFKKFLTKMLID